MMVTTVLHTADIYDYIAALIWVAVALISATALIKITVMRRIRVSWTPLVLNVLAGGCLATAALTPPDYDGMWRSVGAAMMLISVSYCCIRLIKQDEREREQ